MLDINKILWILLVSLFLSGNSYAAKSIDILKKEKNRGLFAKLSYVSAKTNKSDYYIKRKKCQSQLKMNNILNDDPKFNRYRIKKRWFKQCMNKS